MIEKEHIFDKRIIERNMKRGRLTKEQYEGYLAGLADEAEKADEITVEVSEGEFKIEFPDPVDDEE